MFRSGIDSVKSIRPLISGVDLGAERTMVVFAPGLGKLLGAVEGEVFEKNFPILGT